MSTLKVTCAEKYVLIDQAFQFDFPVQYSKFQQLDQEQFQTQVHDQDVIIIRVCPHLALHQINIQAIRIIDL